MEKDLNGRKEVKQTLRPQKISQEKNKVPGGRKAKGMDKNEVDG